MFRSLLCLSPRPATTDWLQTSQESRTYALSIIGVRSSSRGWARGGGASPTGVSSSKGAAICVVKMIVVFRLLSICCK